LRRHEWAPDVGLLRVRDIKVTLQAERGSSQ
jgi:hypothetical protein